MSKAFLRESDFEEIPDPPRLAPSLPIGAKNYLTAEGATRLRAELTRLLEHERPPLAARVADPESRTALKALDQRIRHLQESLRTAVISPDAGPADVVRFGATVTLREPDGTESRYRIVGVDETDAEQNWISWQSPLARALLQSRLGQHLTFQGPRRATAFEITAIHYGATLP